MQKIIGKLVGKSLVKTGISENGNWSLVNFFIEKTHDKKKIKIIFTAMGKKVAFIDSLVIGERLSIQYFPKCKERNGYWNTELIVIDVVKHVKRTAIPVSLNGEVVNKEDFLPKQNNEIKFDNTSKVESTKVSYCRRCGTKVMHVEYCDFCESGH